MTLSVYRATLTPYSERLRSSNYGDTPLNRAYWYRGSLVAYSSGRRPRLNPRAEPEHYIRALATAEAEKNEGAGAEPLGAVTMPTPTNRAPGPLHRGDLTHEFRLPHARRNVTTVVSGETVGDLPHVLALGWSGTG